MKNLEKNLEIKRHHYTECGLTNVYIDCLHTTDNSGKETVIVPSVPEFHWLIAKDILEFQALNGNEIRFLRSEMGLRKEDLAKELGVSTSAVKGWENRKSEKASVEEPVGKKLRKLARARLITGKYAGKKTFTFKKASNTDDAEIIFLKTQKTSDSDGLALAC